MNKITVTRVEHGTSWITGGLDNFKEKLPDVILEENTELAGETIHFFNGDELVFSFYKQDIEEEDYQLLNINGLEFLTPVNQIVL